MKESGLYPDIPWVQLEAIHKARMDKQTYPIHWIAHALRPNTCGPESKLPASVFDTVREYLTEHLSKEEAALALKEFIQFRLKSGKQHSPFFAKSAVYDDTFSPAMAWRCLLLQESILAPVAVKILNTLANSVPSERSFSATNHVHTKERNRLATAKADNQTFCYMNYRVLLRLKNPGTAGNKRWSDLSEKGWIDLEDEYLALFLNVQGRPAVMGNDGNLWVGVLQQTGDLLALGSELGEEEPNTVEAIANSRVGAKRAKKRRKREAKSPV